MMKMRILVLFVLSWAERFDLEGWDFMSRHWCKDRRGVGRYWVFYYQNFIMEIRILL